MFEPRMCDTCCIPLDPFMLFISREVEYRHPAWVGVEWDHVPVPVPPDPGRLRGVCDFCSSDHPVTAFETEKMIVMFDGLSIHEFSEPWSACRRCAVHIRRRSPHLLIERALQVIPGTLNQPDRWARRTRIKALFMNFFKAKPEEVGL
ncbi:hypothetical protein DWB77_02136 [Streptomyces hundungensis]|uniref:Uncharacterized protein n=1 Tax=Streptomyces hundungensis TaxID=1077946 RepID=A0A387H860_9ACTN|nr:hypothetical protein DWB77_02136 [Streptomyces hundungensis]